MSKNNTAFKFVKWFLILYLSVTVLLPLAVLLTNIHVGDIPKIIDSEMFFTMLKNSVVTTAVSTVISVTSAFLLAYCINRTNIRYKSVLSMLFTVPMLIPSISHGMGLVLIFGDNGIITNAFNININLFGYIGIIAGSVMYSFPIAFLMFNDAFRYEDYTTYEAAKVLGLSKWRCFCAITMPNMRQALVASALAVFTMVFTDYGVPLTTGGKVMTLPVYMYREVVGLMNFSEGAIIGMVILLPSLIAFIIDLKRSQVTSSNSITKMYEINKNKKRDILAYIICIAALIVICLPVFAFAMLSFVKKYPLDMTLTLSNVKKCFEIGIGKYFINSITIALLTALIGTSLSYFAAYITSRMKKTPSRTAVHLISMLSLAIPGLVLGLSYVLAFNNTPIYSTVFILAIVNVVHFFSSPYLLAYNSLSKFNSNLEDVSQSLGISRFNMLFSVYIPSTQETIMEMYSYFFVNAMITISAVSFLANFLTMPLALLIPQLDAQSFIEGTAFLSLLILFINIISKLILFLLKRYVVKH